ncbi:unnamed protein product [Allacma fusca]|uniref:F-box domain-containing protein n=1 Tax=Allacma fusca TaxID=39272 RepID=A0A8J2J513_9HEXA|nr:unnamed protein product [Allacma fusca]
MDSQQRQHFHNNDDSNRSANPWDTFRPKSVNSNYEPQYAPTMSTLVVSELFLDRLRDVQLLKTCRLVCKSWNTDACKSLRACSQVCIRETSSRFVTFTTLILKKALGPFQHFPSPFQNFHVEGGTFTDPNFLEFVLNIPITSLGLDHSVMTETGSDLNQQQLYRFLAENQGNITNVEIRWLGTFQLDIVNVNFGIKLTHLKRLVFQDCCVSCNHIEFMRYFLSICSPEWLCLNINDMGSVALLLPQDKAKNLKKLELYFGGISTMAWDHLASLRFLELKNVTFQVGDSFNKSFSHQWRSFCQNVSPLLEEFETNLLIYTFEPVLRFPNLKSININELQSGKNILPYFTPDRFPSLVKVKFSFRTPLNIAVDTGVPHSGVSFLDLSIESDNDGNDSLGQDLMQLLLTSMSRQFPGVSSLNFLISQFGCITLSQILNSFPNLTTLGLDGSCDFSCFSGMKKSMITKFLNRRWPVEGIPFDKSIADFIALDTIKLGRAFVLDPDMIRYCLPRVPKLRQVYLHWLSIGISTPGLHRSH